MSITRLVRRAGASMKKTRIAIVNYRTPQLVIDCLRSLENEIQSLGDCQVAVVENDSRDGSGEKIQQAIDQQHWGAWAQLIPLDKNLGFAGGNNAALKPFLSTNEPPDYILLLNPDTVIRPGAVTSLIAFMDANPKVGIAGSRLEDPDGTPQRSAFRFPSVWSEFEWGLRLGFVSRLLSRWVVAPPVRSDNFPTDWVAGASMIVRKAVFDAIGLMDDEYFLYFEEVDFCLRANRAGWPCWYVPESHVVHLVGQSSGVTDTKKPAKRMPRYWFASRRRYFRKNYSWLYLVLTNIACTVGFALWRVRRWIQRKPDPDPPYFLWDFVRFNFILDPSRGGIA